MSGRVIQGFFLGGQPRVAAGVVAPPQPGFAAQAKAGPRPAAPPKPAFAPKQAAVAQLFGGNDAFAVDPARLGLNGSGGRALPDAVRGKMEAAFGADFSSVRVHVGPQAERVGAIAFTLGQDIYFAPGRFQPDTVQGQQLLGHELAHVVQQRQGRVRNPLGSGVAVVQDRALEAEADRLGMRAAVMSPKLKTLKQLPSARFQSLEDLPARRAGVVTAQGGILGKLYVVGGNPSRESMSIPSTLPKTRSRSSMTGEAAVQMKCNECQKDKGHYSYCSRHKHNRSAVRSEAKTKNNENGSWLNMQHYRPGWVKKQGITEEMVKEFVRGYGKIRGHHSGSPDTDDGEQQNTKEDLKAYKSWHEGIYGWKK